jgi:hypothetical protein
VAANSAAIAPPSSNANTAARSEPAALMTATTSSICSSSVGARGTGSDRPDPRRSKMMSRENDASRSKYPAIAGSSQ